MLSFCISSMVRIFTPFDKSGCDIAAEVEDGEPEILELFLGLISDFAFSPYAGLAFSDSSVDFIVGFLQLLLFEKLGRYYSGLSPSFFCCQHKVTSKNLTNCELIEFYYNIDLHKMQPYSCILENKNI